MNVYEHSPSSQNLQEALRSTLPYSINLVYRTQHPNSTQYARVLATFSPDATAIPKCWVAAYFDNSKRPETDLWIFAATEVPGHSGSTDGGSCLQCKNLVLSLLDYMSGFDIPPLRPEYLPALEVARLHEKEYPELGPDVRFRSSPGIYMRHLLLPGVVTLGAVNEQVVQICADAGLIRDEFPSRDSRLNKFFFKVASLPTTKELPSGLRWGDVREEDISIVQARTNIPRGRNTLLSLKSMAIFDDSTNKPVSWTFLGLDGSLTTLHTEPEYRGRGLAKALAAKIIKDYAPELAVDDQGNAWAHADVYEGNVQSEGVCRSVGGYEGTKIFWIRIDLTRAGTLSKRDPID